MSDEMNEKQEFDPQRYVHITVPEGMVIRRAPAQPIGRPPLTWRGRVYGRIGDFLHRTALKMWEHK